MAAGTAGALAHCRWSVDHRHAPRFVLDEENNGQNTLLRHLPDSVSLQDGFILEVHLDNAPKRQWEHAGLLCYFDGTTFVAFNKEFTGKQSIFAFSQQDGKPIKGTGGPQY